MIEAQFDRLVPPKATQTMAVTICRIEAGSGTAVEAAVLGLVTLP